MRKILTTLIGAAAFAAVAVPSGGQTMSTRLSEPVAVPLDFLDWIEKDPAWLADALGRLGVTSGYDTGQGLLTAVTLEALTAANRIRSFAYFAAPGLRPPYFDLMVDEGGKPVRCVTLFPQSIAPEIGAFDFAAGPFPADAADPTILDLCRVSMPRSAEYLGLDREEFAQRYFEGNGDLKIEFADLGQDPAFLATTLDHGIFIGQSSPTGRARKE